MAKQNKQIFEQKKFQQQMFDMTESNDNNTGNHQISKNPDEPTEYPQQFNKKAPSINFDQNKVEFSNFTSNTNYNTNSNSSYSNSEYSNNEYNYDAYKQQYTPYQTYDYSMEEQYPNNYNYTQYNQYPQGYNQSYTQYGQSYNTNNNYFRQQTDYNKSFSPNDYQHITAIRMQREAKRKTKIRVCTNCSTTNTPSWRRSRDGKKLLCNACGLYQKLHNRPRPFSKALDGRTKATKVPFDNPYCIKCNLSGNQFFMYTESGVMTCRQCGEQESYSKMAPMSNQQGYASPIQQVEGSNNYATHQQQPSFPTQGNYGYSNFSGYANSEQPKNPQSYQNYAEHNNMGFDYAKNYEAYPTYSTADNNSSLEAGEQKGFYNEESKYAEDRKYTEERKYEDDSNKKE